MVKKKINESVPTVDDLQVAAQGILDAMKEPVERIRRVPWPPQDGLLPLVMRSIVCRQFDSLTVISKLVADGMGYATGAMLRPSCEERIWTAYLLKISPTSAEQLVRCMGRMELVDSLRAQDRVGGRRSTRRLGLLPDLKRCDGWSEDVESKLVEIARDLEWPRQCKNGKRLPSVRWIAKEVALVEIYDLIYHGTSRFVHFRVNELYRSVWGVPSSGWMSIRPTHMEGYKSHFSLYWGLSLFMSTTIPILESAENAFGFFDGEPVSEEVLSAAQTLGRLGRVPIITAQELAWPYAQ